MTKEEFGYVATNDWPLLVAAKSKIYGYAAELYRQKHLKPAIFRNDAAAEKKLNTLYKQYLKNKRL